MATLDVIEEEGLLSRAQVLGRATLDRLKTIALAAAGALGTVRGLGMYWGVEVRPAGPRSGAEVADELLYACLRRGLSFKVGGGDIVTLCPPLNISTEELDRALGILAAAVADWRP